jgi:hypothetical protein
MTQSESEFERYLSGQRLAWVRISESTQKEPDYRVMHTTGDCVFEVKEFDAPEIIPSGGYDPLPPIRHKIKRAIEKFEHYRKYCCGVVLWGSKSILRSAHPFGVFPAAFGQYVDREPKQFVDAGIHPQSFSFYGEAVLSANQNTTASGIVILTSFRLNDVWVEAWQQLAAKRGRGEAIKPWEQADLCQRIAEQKGVRYSYEGTIRVIVLENPYARIPFPPDLFVGPFDQHWRLQSGRFRLAFMGSEIERLRGDNVPFVFL